MIVVDLIVFSSMQCCGEKWDGNVTVKTGSQSVFRILVSYGRLKSGAFSVNVNYARIRLEK